MSGLRSGNCPGLCEDTLLQVLLPKWTNSWQWGTLKRGFFCSWMKLHLFYSKVEVKRCQWVELKVERENGGSLLKLRTWRYLKKSFFQDPIFSYKLFGGRENFHSIQIMKSLLNDSIHKVTKPPSPSKVLKIWFLIHNLQATVTRNWFQILRVFFPDKFLQYSAMSGPLEV